MEKFITTWGKITGDLTQQEDLNTALNDRVKTSTFNTLAGQVSTNTSNNGVVMVSTSEPVAIKSGTSTIVLGNGTFAGPTSTGATHTYAVKIDCVNGDSTVDEKAFDATITVGQKK